MSSAVMCAELPPLSTPLLTPFLAPGRSRLLELPRGVVPGSRLEVRPAPATVSSGIAAIDALTGGLPRGALTEIFGRASSGRTSLMLAALAEATRRQEVCALVDAGDSLHPESAAAAGMDLQRLLWIRCGNYSLRRHEDTEGIDDLRIDDFRVKNQQPTTKDQRLISSPRIGADQRGSNRQSKIVNRQWETRLEQVLKTTDLLLQSGGFGMVVVDLADVPPRFARRIPLASWFRFRHAVENTPTVLLVMEQEPYAKTCASLVLRMQRNQHSAITMQHSAFSSQHSADGAFFQKQRMEPGKPPVQQPIFNGNGPPHAQILRGLPVEAEIVHARLPRKPNRSAAAQFDTHANWVRSLAG